MDNFEADLITICDEDGNEFDFEILDILEFENNNYFILLPVEEEEDEDENGAYYILREEIDENGESDLIARSNTFATRNRVLDILPTDIEVSLLGTLSQIFKTKLFKQIL